MAENNHLSPEEAHIEREVSRRMGPVLRQRDEQINDLREIVQQFKTDLIRQNNIISSLTSEPLMFGQIVKVHKYVDPSCFKMNDEVLVIDPKSPHYLSGGMIVSGNGQPVLNENGECVVKLTSGIEATFAVGVEGGAPAQIRLSKKQDGTYAVVNLDGKPWEVRGVPDLDLEVGDSVKVRPDSKAIVGKGYDLTAGPICNVVAVSEAGVEVMHKGDVQLVYNPRRFELEEGDRVACDSTMFSIVQKLPPDNRNRYKLTTELTLTWDDIGGLETAKQELRDALELPFQHPDLYKYYGIDAIRGVLLYGPQGCGKTLLARVAARAVADIHGKGASETGYIYVKAPELLDKWVGNTEKEIRSLFERGRRHYREHGYKAILAIDEADAIMPQRGMRRSSDITDTIVPMFLGEMDGIDPVQTAENPIVILMTNRAEMLDPAVTRPGRISRHIKIDRPTEITSIDILAIHAKSIPFEDERNRMAILAITASDLFSKSRLLYRINNEHDFTMGDCVNGAMLANIVEMAKMSALHRDLAMGSRSGVTTDDFRQSVSKVYRQQRGLNHSFDVHDFCEKLGLQMSAATVERCFGSA